MTLRYLVKSKGFLHRFPHKLFLSEFSTIVRKDLAIKDVRIDISDVQDKNPVTLEVCSHWEQYATFEVNDANSIRSDLSYGISSRYADDSTPDQLHLKFSSSHGFSTQSAHLKVLVPEYVNIAINARSTNLSIRNKIYGDLNLVCEDGTVSIDKCKGAKLILSLGNADLKINKILEGNINAQCRNIDGKIMNGHEIKVTCGGNVTLDAVYGQQTSITAEKGMKLGLFKGSLEANVISGETTVSGIDGSFQVANKKGDISLQVNSVRSRNTHTAEAPNGSISCALDPEIKAFLECSTYENSKAQISIQSDSFSNSESVPNRTIGRLSGQSSLKRPNSSRSGDSGKINLQGYQQLHKDKKDSLSDDELPRIIFHASENIDVKTLSWIEIIRRKHGLGSK